MLFYSAEKLAQRYATEVVVRTAQHTCGEEGDDHDGANTSSTNNVEKCGGRDYDDYDDDDDAILAAPSPPPVNIYDASNTTCLENRSDRMGKEQRRVEVPIIARNTLPMS